jgi:hypothetical protein
MISGVHAYVAAARIADGGEAPTDLKLLDKILFQIGSHIK